MVGGGEHSNSLHCLLLKSGLECQIKKLLTGIAKATWQPTSSLAPPAPSLPLASGHHLDHWLMTSMNTGHSLSSTTVELTKELNFHSQKPGNIFIYKRDLPKEENTGS